MTALSKNWLTEKHIDFEYKKYLLLAYLQEVSKQFSVTKLYPWLGELIEHYKNAVAVRENKQNLKNLFPQRLSGIDPATKQLTHENILNDDELMQELSTIIEYAIPQFENRVEEGKTVYDIVEDHLYIQPVGIIPLHAECGYMFLRGGETASTNVYEYQITFFEKATEQFKAIHTHFIKTFASTISTTFQSIKSDLIRENKSIPNPAVYSIETEMALPLEETFLPIAKRMLVRHLSQEEK
ncbi:MAG: hypothetical protein ACHQHP_01765 [Bacteroidia bacterium]